MGRNIAILAVIFLMSVSALAATQGAQKRIIAYVPNWIDLNSYTELIDYGRLSQINVAFENPVNESGELSFHTAETGLIARAHREHVRVFLSIGGGSAATDPQMMRLYFRLISESNRAAFIEKLLAYLQAHDFDGLDVDIEGPSINADYGAFIADLSKALKPRGKGLTAALSRGYGGDRVPNSVLDALDSVNIMAYDGAGYWAPDAPGQHSSVDLAKESLDYWIGRGLAKEKAILGVPFYGYGFGGAFRRRDYPYSEIVAKYPGAESADVAGDRIWYNGAATIRTKARMAIDRGIGGVMIWSLNCDVKGRRSLLTALADVLNPDALETRPAVQRYELGVDSLPQAGAPKGRLEGPFLFKSRTLQNTVRKYWIYVPAQYTAAKPACLLVFQDGQRAVNPTGVLRVQNVLDNLISRKAIPVTIGLFITPGQIGDDYPDSLGYGNPNNRSVEYDSLNDAYARFLVDELLPEVSRKYAITANPAGRAIGGASSGAICAFTVAWTRPDAFRNVISLIGSFTNIRGGHVYPDLVRNSPAKTIRVFIQDGRNDNRNPRDQDRDWHLQNEDMAAALAEKEYDLKFVFGNGDHSDNHGGAILPEILQWIWRDYPK